LGPSTGNLTVEPARVYQFPSIRLTCDVAVVGTQIATASMSASLTKIRFISKSSKFKKSLFQKVALRFGLNPELGLACEIPIEKARKPTAASGLHLLAVEDDPSCVAECITKRRPLSRQFFTLYHVRH